MSIRVVDLGSALGRGGEHGFHGAVVGFRRILELGVAFASLVDALFGEGAHLFRHLKRNDGRRERIGLVGHNVHPSYKQQWVKSGTADRINNSAEVK